MLNGDPILSVRENESHFDCAGLQKRMIVSVSFPCVSRALRFIYSINVHCNLELSAEMYDQSRELRNTMAYFDYHFKSNAAAHLL